MPARDNLRSTRSREDIDHDAEVRTKVQVLRARMLDAFQVGKYGEIVEELARIALDPRTPRKTRVVALTAYARAAGSLVAEAPTVNVAAGVSISPADLLRLIPAEIPGGTARCGGGLPSPETSPGLPTRDLQLEPRLTEAGCIPVPSPEDGSPSCVRLPGDQGPHPTPPRAPVATDGLGDPTTGDAKRCLFPWCGIDGKRCPECAGA